VVLSGSRIESEEILQAKQKIQKKSKKSKNEYTEAKTKSKNLGI